ncbi:isoleucyl-tRNA synthetase [Mycoplasmoides fastidiosum]|uniref:Isoleucine--tRNA ligase n=1 Tax=Mycoplasmoides fastidiosum TaxID=92758 RepID=A0ABU0LZS9_9BACT|nr:isoleucine--tRNA ligase [Mycoplasmoides fastidiosum]MDQ0514209.1 isoleucyl-tRNA synthetase [Mycoplasmoides fastidiosum]UUD37382.1 isoleucine--tRNA ligase [Mycoplasmoides fastidiosum]
MDYRKTLNIQTTPFEMRANLGTKELVLQKFWKDHQIYQKLLQQNQKNPQWVLHDGPPYANGNIHVGHAVNKILKDIIVRTKTFQGFYSPYIPGWDTHGLPIEWALIKQNKNTDPNLTPTEKRQNCKDFATEQLNNQKEQFQRLGMLSDFDDIYVTYNHQFEMDQLHVFMKMVQKNLVFRALKPVYWSWSSKTALAEAEIIYGNAESDSIYVGMATTTSFLEIPVGTKLMIWTTTPWTLPSNLAIAVHPDLEYHLVKINQETVIVSATRLTAVAELLKWNNPQILHTYKGQQLEYLKYVNPLLDEEHFVVVDEYVSDADGTGLVHNAPGFGVEDYTVCKRYGIEIYCPIDDDGKFDHQVKIPELKGVFYAKANALIIEWLQTKQALYFHDRFVHSVAHDWRTNKPLIYRATNQWFVNIDDIKLDIINVCKTIDSHPKWILKQLQDTVLRRKEWCISRQRLWGVPIPILFDGNNEPILDLEQIKYTISILQEKGCDAWFELSAEAFLSPKNRGLKGVTKSQDIMDVWFDSGTSYNILTHHHLNPQAELYLEGSDQFRGWFNSSLITSVIVNQQSPYKNLISHGFILDEKGFKMSKSKGNVVDPLKVCAESGADVLRLWVASTDYTDDMRLGKTIFEQAIDNYRKIRNSLFRFSLANLGDFNPATDMQTQLAEVDNYVLAEFHQTVQAYLQELDNYSFYRATKKLLNFLNFYSSWYFNLVKDVLYCNQANDPVRRQVQTVLYKILKTALVLLAPILPHTCEEAYQVLNEPSKQESVHLEKWVDLAWIKPQAFDQQKWEQFFKLKDLVYEETERLRDQKIINSNVEAKVEVNKKYQTQHFGPEQLTKYLMVAELSFQDLAEQDVRVTKTSQPICDRCKLHFPAEQLNQQNLSPRCANVLKNLAN